MAVLTNKSIASTYKSVLSIGATTESALTTSIQQLTDGLGNSSPLSMSTTQIQFNNDANTFSFPATRGTSGQILKLADANGTLSWADDDLSNTLDFSGGTGTGSVTLDTQTLAFTGTANQIETSASSQAITLSFPTAGVTLPDGSIATTQTASDNSTKVATTAYVEAAVAAGGVGNVTKTGTPSTNEVAIWTNSNTIKGDASFTMSSSTFQINNSTASSQSNLIISNNDTAINSIPANIIFNSNTLTSYKTLAQIYATKTDADIANASGKLNFSTTDAGVPSVKFIINSNGLSEFFGNVNAYNTSSLKLYSLGQEGYSNTEFLEIKKSSTNAIFNVNKVGTGSVRGLEFQTGGSPKLTISSGGAATFSGDIIRKGNVGNISFEGASVTNINAQIQYDQISDYVGQLFFKTRNGETETLDTRLTISSGGITSLLTNQAKTSESNVEYALLGRTNEATNYSALQLLQKGNASNSLRSWSFQTIEAGVANAGNIIFQPSGGNVGIGVTPTYKLDVGGSSAVLRVKETSGTDVRIVSGGSIGYIGTYTNHELRLLTNGTEKLTITSGGNVGIGTDSPSFYGLSFKNIVTISSAAATTDYAIIELAGGSAAGGGIQFGNQTVRQAGIFSLNGSDLGFYTNSTNSGAGLTEAMLISSGGNIQLDGSMAIGTNVFANTYKLRAIGVGVAQGSGLFASDNGVYNSIAVYSAGADGFNSSATVAIFGKNTATGRSINAGGTINAGGNDYAEYMTKGISDDINKGDIVGIDTDGLLTNVFSDAISFVIKSTNPSYVGGDTWFTEKKPEKTEEQSQEEFDLILQNFEDRMETLRSKVDRIAFSGQVPCNVMGANVGDYIIPKQKSDGKIIGEAVSDPTFDKYKLSVGKVWKIMEDGRSWVAVKIG